jgi:hypothetical protein
MSPIHVHIDRLVLRGIDPGESHALAGALRKELARVLAEPAVQGSRPRPSRTPVLRLGMMPMEPGLGGARKLGSGMARVIGKGITR